MPLKDREKRREFDRLRSKVRRESGYVAPRIAAHIWYVTAIKSETPCSDCKRFFPPICMDFDHVRGVKTEEVSRLLADGVVIEVLQAEIDKCDLVCANCHRLRSQATNWNRNLASTVSANGEAA